MSGTGVLQQGLKKYLSEADLERLAKVRVGIAGAGGLGSNIAVMLVRSGIRSLTIADYDRVEPSNLNRQFFFPEDVGLFKVEALLRRLMQLEPELDIQIFSDRILPDAAPNIFSACSIVAEAMDMAEGKAELCSALLRHNFFVVAASGLGGYGRPLLTVRYINKNFVCVGDGESAVSSDCPPLAPRVMQAAALQADVILTKILQSE